MFFGYRLTLPRRILLVALLISPTVPVCRAGHWTTMTPEERFEKVLGLRHGPFGPYDDDTRQLVDAVVTDPQTYCPMVDEVLHAPDQPDDLAEFDVYGRLGGGLGLAEILGPEHCASSVERFFDEILQSYSASRLAPGAGDGENSATQQLRRAARGNCSALLISVLRIMREFDDPYAVEACLAIIESFEPAKGDAGKVSVMLEYMAKVAPQRPQIRAELERMYNDRESRLYRQPGLKKVIDAIDARPHSARDPEDDVAKYKKEIKTAP